MCTKSYLLGLPKHPPFRQTLGSRLFNNNFPNIPIIIQKI